ncbi:type II toxin-antitoxin system VapC family toxin [Kutzneria sp. NPDC051319]|uniref:type II toxin-antitoxin system VapC family toxin n=1 Tax=Kutzneria sp. NPDC051319 TaxID=3155047 RepID=UPI00341583F2
MIIDTSAIVAIINREPGHERLEQHLLDDPAPKIGGPTVVEAGMVLVGRFGARGQTLLARFLQYNDIKTVPFTDQHIELALDAFGRFGEGRHPAGLNMGDCLTYAVAAHSGEPLLYVGNDFPKTDLKLAE